MWRPVTGNMPSFAYLDRINKVKCQVQFLLKDWIHKCLQLTSQYIYFWESWTSEQRWLLNQYIQLSIMDTFEGQSATQIEVVHLPHGGYWVRKAVSKPPKKTSDKWAAASWGWSHWRAPVYVQPRQQIKKNWRQVDYPIGNTLWERMTNVRVNFKS